MSLAFGLLRYKNLLQWWYLRYYNDLNNCLYEINLENGHTVLMTHPHIFVVTPSIVVFMTKEILYS